MRVRSVAATGVLFGLAVLGWWLARPADTALHLGATGGETPATHERGALQSGVREPPGVAVREQRGAGSSAAVTRPGVHPGEPAASVERPFALRLCVIDQSLGTPAVGLRIEAMAGDGRVHALVTGRDGRCETAAELPAGLVELAVPDVGVPASAWRLEPDRVLLPVVPGPDVSWEGQVRIAAWPPAPRGSIQVLAPDGSPAVQVPLWVRGQTLTPLSDAGGRVWVPLPQDGGEEIVLTCMAHVPDRGWVAAPTVLRARNVTAGATIGRVQLVEGGTLRCRVVDHALQPIGGAQCEATFRMDEATQALLSGSWSPGPVLTGPDGTGELRGLLPGAYSVQGSHLSCRPSTSDAVDVVVALGQIADTQLVLGPRVRTVHTAFAGRVVDRKGVGCAYLTLWWHDGDPDEPWHETCTGPDGSFAMAQWTRPPVPSIALRSALDGRGAGIEPVELTVAFGTTGIVLRQTREVPVTRATFHVLDAETGEPVPSLDLLRWLPSLREWRRFGKSDETSGLVTLTDQFTEPVRIKVTAAGYRAFEMVLRPAARSDESVHTRVELRPGMTVRLLVQDDAGAPLAGVEVWIGRNVVATTDAEGIAAVDTPLRGRQLLLRGRGFKPAVSSALTGAETIQLERERQRQR